MKHDTWQAADRLLTRALDLAPEERRAFVDRSADDPRLRARVLRLLDGAEDDREIATGLGFDLGAGQMAAAIEEDETLFADGSAENDGADFRRGDVLGRYRILRELGSGGMAVVYLATRDDGEFAQEVAVKVIRAEQESRETGSPSTDRRSTHREKLKQRLERERAILARARHRNLATVIDGGTTPDDRPYLVLEYVDGLPIDRYCQRQRLDLEARLRLFLQVADGVDYAHRRLVVHRDIKPSNILVDREGTVKLLDFGIAKPIGERDDDLTQTGIAAMTPAWASPEQLRGEQVTTASDVYQLGLLLSVLVAGRSPLPAGSSLGDLYSRLSNEEPRRPSEIVTDEARRAPGRRSGTAPTAAEIAHQRRTTPQRLRRQLRGDLDSIVLRCLRREPEHRYPSVASLAEDVRSHLEGGTVRARRATFLYRASRLARRHWLAASALAALLVVLVGAAAVTAVQANRLAAERDRANEEARNADLTLDYLIESFSVLDPSEARGAALTAPEVLRRGAERIDEDFPGGPIARAKLKSAIARLFEELGRYDEAEPLLRDALVLYRREKGGDSSEALSATTDLAGLLLRQGRFGESEKLLESNLELRRRHPGPDRSGALSDLSNLANVHLMLGRYDDAERGYREALALAVERDGADSTFAIDISNNLAVSLGSLGREAEALGLSEEVYRRRVATLGEDDPRTLGAASNLASQYRHAGRLVEAENLLREVLASRSRVLGPEHPETVASISELALVHRATGDRESAISGFERALEARRRLLGDRHRDTLATRINLGQVLVEAGRFDGARTILEQATAVIDESLGPGHPYSVEAWSQLGLLYALRAHNGAARAALEHALAGYESAGRTSQEAALMTRYNLAAVLTRLGDHDAALDQLEAAIADGLRQSIDQDPDFAPLHRSERFQRLVQ